MANNPAMLKCVSARIVFALTVGGSVKHSRWLNWRWNSQRELGAKHNLTKAARQVATPR